MKWITIAFLGLCFWQEAQAQLSVGYFPFQSILAITSNTEKRFWVDYKLETNGFVSNLNMELSPKWNFRKMDQVNYYTGMGLSFNPAYAFSDLSVVNGGFVEVGTRIKPLQYYRNFQVIFEISLYVNQALSGGNLRTRLGAAWNFQRR